MPRRPTGPAKHILALSLPDAAAAIGVSLNTLQGWVDAGEIPLCRPVTVAGTPLKLVLWRDLEAFMDRHHDERIRLAGKREVA